MRHCFGKSTSPLSACSSSRSSANRLDLPDPFAPIRPMRSPGLSETSAPSSSVFVPRRRVSCERRIMTGCALYARPVACCRLFAHVFLALQRPAIDVQPAGALRAQREEAHLRGGEARPARRRSAQAGLLGAESERRRAYAG